MALVIPPERLVILEEMLRPTVRDVLADMQIPVSKHSDLEEYIVELVRETYCTGIQHGYNSTMENIEEIAKDIWEKKRKKAP